MQPTACSLPGTCRPIDLHGLKTYDLQSRPSKVFVEDLGRPATAEVSVGDWVDSLPRSLAATDLRKVRDHICKARRDGRTVVAALGGHVIKTGCGPYLIDWVQRDILSGIVLNGAAAIHDFELALAGKTSEDVGATLAEGKFGMARETADAFAVAARAGAEHDLGLGWALGKHMEELHCPHAESSLVLAAYRANIPCTIHVALGTDIVHMHPHVCGAAMGAASMIDFRRLCTVVSTMQQGVWMNLGSAVMLPEVFLKAVSVCHNFGHNLDGLVSVTVDKHSQYRNRVNVLDRPSSEGIELIGHHELMIPLLHAAVAQGMAKTEEIAGPEQTPRAA
jgi:deoxyhypusine synthase